MPSANTTQARPSESIERLALEARIDILWQQSLSQQEIEPVKYFAQLVAEECAKIAQPMSADPNDYEPQVWDALNQRAAAIRAKFGVKE